MAIHSAVLLASKNTKLRAVNKKQKAKRQGKRSYITNGRTLIVIKGVNLIQAQKELLNTIAV